MTKIKFKKIIAIFIIAVMLFFVFAFTACGNATVPTAPRNFTTVAGDTQVILSWLVPLNDGGSPIIGYQVSMDNGATWVNSSSNTTHTFIDLTNGAEYTFKVRAVNAIGNGEAASATVVPVATTVASAPQNFTATAGNSQVILNWTAPLSNGGSDIIRFEVSSDNGITWVTASSNTGHTFTGLVNDTQYTFKVRAVNAVGNGADAVSPAIPHEMPLIKISVGVMHTLAIDLDGNLWVWGTDSWGQLGAGATQHINSPVQIMVGTKFAFVSAGSEHSLAIDLDGNLWAWGYNLYGQVGDGTSGTGVYRDTPVQIMADIKFSYVSAGAYNSFAIDKNGNLWAWGNNHNGQLGDGTTIDKRTPVRIMSGTKFVTIKPFTEHGIFGYSFAIDEDNNLWGWGLNNVGQLGDGTQTSSASPVQIMAGTKFITIEARERSSFAIDKDGNLWSWGAGWLGDGIIHRTTPIQIMAGTKFITIETNGHNFAIDEHHNLWAWGSNLQGQVGGGTWTNIDTPVQIMADTKFAFVSAGFEHSLAIDLDGNLWAWGSNYWGQLGCGTGFYRNSPVQIMKGTKFAFVSAGFEHSLAIDLDGNLWAWGYNLYGQVGDGTSGMGVYRDTPVKITFA